MTTVELHAAFVWTCDDCGRDNFTRGVTVAPESIDPGDLPDARNADAEAIGEWLESGGGGDFLMAPDAVTCGHCGSRFATEAP